MSIKLIGLLFIVVLSHLEAMEGAKFKVGVAVGDITPRVWPVHVRGHKRIGAYDPLQARAMVLEQGETKVAVVMLDALGTGTETCLEMKRLASEKTGIPVENMMMASTHTHSTPSSGVIEGNAALVDYRKVFFEGVVSSIVKAHENLQPASVGWAEEDLAEDVRNRRWFLKPGKMPPNPWNQYDQVKMNPGTKAELLERPAGPIDPAVMVLSFMDERGKQPLGLLANYALHYVGGMSKDQVSGDYFGEFSRLMPTRLKAKEEFMAMMSNGASGDINNLPFLLDRPPREPGEQMKIVGRKTADAAWRAWKKIEAWSSDLPLAMLEESITLKLRKPSKFQLLQAKAVLAMKDKKKIAELPVKSLGYAKQTLKAEAGGEVSLPLQAIRIGEYAIVGIPFEVLVEIGLELKEKSPFESTMVIGLANGRFGYLPTPEQHQLGGYETWLGTCKVEDQASVKINEQLLAMLKTLKEADEDL